MKRLNVKDVRAAINYVCQNDGINLDKVSDEELLKYDFVRDLNVGNVRLINVAGELQQVKGFRMPYDVLRQRADDTIGEFINTINTYLSKN
jgi:hypothetical protein